MFNDGALKHSVINRARNPTAGKGERGMRKKDGEFLLTFDLRRVTGPFARVLAL